MKDVVFYNREPLCRMRLDGSVKLGEPLRVAAGEVVVELPVGYCSDGASIPVWLQWFMRPFGTQAAPAFVHDYLYEHGWDNQGKRLSRKQSDQIFRDLLIANGVSKVKAVIAYYALRVFGWAHWQNRKEKKMRRINFLMGLIMCVCLCWAAGWLTGCVATNYSAQKYKVEEGQAVLAQNIEVSNFKLLVYDTKKELVADLFDGSRFGVAEVATDPDSEAIKEAGKTIIETAAGAGGM